MTQEVHMCFDHAVPPQYASQSQKTNWSSVQKKCLNGLNALWIINSGWYSLNMVDNGEDQVVIVNTDNTGQ